MDVKSPVDRVTTVDFFAIFVPGSYVVVSLFIAYSSIVEDGTTGLLTAIRTGGELASQWPIAFVTFLMAYLFGNLPRAFPAGATDRFCTTVREVLRGKKGAARRPANSGHRKAFLESDEFPYASLLNRLWRDLEIRRETDSEGLDPMVIDFDCWKLIIQREWPEMASAIRSLEARGRYFVGMIWASPVGFFSAGLAIAAALTRADGATQRSPDVATSVGVCLVTVDVILVAVCLWMISSARFPRAGVVIGFLIVIVMLLVMGTAAYAFGDDPWVLPGLLWGSLSLVVGTTYGYCLRMVRMEEVFRVTLMLDTVRSRGVGQVSDMPGSREFPQGQ